MGRVTGVRQMDKRGPRNNKSATAFTKGVRRTTRLKRPIFSPPSHSLPEKQELLLGFFLGSQLDPVLLDTTLHMFVSDRIPGEAPAATVLSLTCFF